MLPRDKMSLLNGEKSRGASRLAALFDEGRFTETDALLSNQVATGFGLVDGTPCCAFAQTDSVFNAAAARRVAGLLELARKNGSPVVGIYDCSGASLPEGIDLLTAYGTLLRSMSNLSGVIPQIALVTGPCLGTSALLAAAADFTVLTEGAELRLSAASAEENNAASVSLKAGTEEEAIEKVRALLSYLPANNLAVAPIHDFAAADTAALTDLEPDVFEAASRIADAGSLLAVSEALAEETLTAFGTLAGQPVAFAGVNGKLTADGCRKLVRFARFADAFSLPLITLVNSDGFAPDAGLSYCAKLASVYAEATCPQLAVVIGNAVGPVFTALAGKTANADTVFAWPNAVIAPLAPETAVSILYNDRISADCTREQLMAEYADGEASALTAASKGALDDVIDPAATRSLLISALDMVGNKRETGLPKKHAVL